MKRLGETMRRDPSPDEKLILDKVVELATGWREGAYSLDDVREQSSGWQRFMALRFARLSSPEKKALMAMIDALVDDQKTQPPKTHFVDGRLMADQSPINVTAGEKDVAPLWLTPAELASYGYKLVTNHAGQRVWVAPLYWMDGEPHYPAYDLPPGEQRREREMAMNATYNAYRKRRGPRPAR